MYQNIVYDFDGTISDSYPIFTKALLVLLEHHGMKEDYGACYALLKESVGAALRHFDCRRYCPQHGYYRRGVRRNRYNGKNG